MGIIRATTPQVRGRRRTQTRHPTNSISSVVRSLANGVNDKERLGLSKGLTSAQPCSVSSKSNICRLILGIWHEPAQVTFAGRSDRGAERLGNCTLGISEFGAVKNGCGRASVAFSKSLMCLAHEASSRRPGPSGTGNSGMQADRRPGECGPPSGERAAILSQRPLGTREHTRCCAPRGYSGD